MTEAVVRQTRRHGPLLLAVGLCVLIGSVLLTSERARAADGPWGKDAAVSVTAIRPPATSGGAAVVSLAWPEPTGAYTGFEVVRDRGFGTPVVASLGADERTFEARWAESLWSTTTFEVRALHAGGATPLQRVSVVLTDEATACTIAWTGSAGSGWSDVRNWAPVLREGDPAQEPRTPRPADHVCFHTGQNLPATVSSGNHQVAKVTDWRVTTPSIRSEGGTLVVTGPASVDGLELAGGTLDFRDTLVVNGYRTRPQVRLDGGTLRLARDVKVDHVVAEANSATTLHGGHLDAGVVDLDAGNIALHGVGGVKVSGVLNAGPSTKLTTGSGGAAFASNRVDVEPGGDLDMAWALEGDPGDTVFRSAEVRVPDGATARLTDVVDLRGGVVWDTRLTLGGELQLTQSLREISGTLSLEPGEPQLLSGGTASFVQLAKVDGVFTNWGTDARIPGDLEIGSWGVNIRGGRLDIGGELTSTVEDPELAISNSGELTLGKALGGGTPWWIWSSSGPNIIRGDVTAAGGLGVESSADVGGEGDTGVGDLTIEGDLTVPADAELVIQAAGERAGALTVTGEATVEGPTHVVLLDHIEADLDVAIVTFPDGKGRGFTDLIVEAGEWADEGVTKDVTVVRSGKDVRLRGSAAGGEPEPEPEPEPECLDGLRVGQVSLEGCWHATADAGVVMTTATIAAGGDDAPGIGGLKLTPVGSAIVRVNTAQQRLLVERGDVELSVPVIGGFSGLPFGIAGLSVGDDLVLGTLRDVDWQMRSARALALPDFLGLPSPEQTLRLIPTGGSAGWQLDVVGQLPDLLGGGTFDLDLPLLGRGLHTGDISLADLDAVFIEQMRPLLLDLRWVADEVWQFTSDAADALQIDGTIDFAPGGGGGTLSVSGLVFGDLFRVPDFDLTLEARGDSRTWRFEGARDSVVRQVRAVYDTAGTLTEAAIELGDGVGESSRPPVASWGDWVSLERLVLQYGGRNGMWVMQGQTQNPSASVNGRMVLDDGGLESASLEFDGLAIGQVADVELDLTYVWGQVFDAEARVVDSSGAQRSGSGTFEFDDGSLVGAEVEFDRIAFGDLTAVDHLAMSFANKGSWRLAGEVTTSGDTTDVDGSLTFRDGILTRAHLDVGGIDLGAVHLEQAGLRLENGTAGTTTFDVDAVVRGPATEAGARLEPVTGTLTLSGGAVTDLSLSVPKIEIAALAYVHDLTLDYSTAAAGTRLAGSGTITSADDAKSMPVKYEVILDGGVVERANLATAGLSVGGLMTFQDLTMEYDRKNPAEICTKLPSGIPSGAAAWALSATTTGGDGAPSEASGCLVLDGRRVVGGELDIAEVGVGDLMTIRNFEAVVAVALPYSVPLLDADGTPTGDHATMARTLFFVDAEVGAGSGTPIAVDGHFIVQDGGLHELNIAIPDLPLTNVVGLEDLEINYVRGDRWDGEADTSYWLSGDVVHAEGRSSVAGGLTFAGATDGGRLDGLEMRAANVPFGPVDLDELAFVYAGGDDPSWSFDGAVSTAGGDEFALSGDLQISDGRVTTASLEMPRLTFGEVLAARDVALEFSRLPNGNETWAGRGSVVNETGSSSSVDVALEFDRNRRLVSGSAEAAEVRWGGLLAIENLSLSGTFIDSANFRWAASGRVAAGSGPASTLSGAMTIDDGRVRSGSLRLRDFAVADLVDVDSLDLQFESSGSKSEWAADLALADGTQGTGRLRFDDGVLSFGQLRLGDVRLGQLLDIENLAISYEAGHEWAASATVRDGDGTSSLAGSLVFTDGKVSGGSLEMDDVTFGPLELRDFDLHVVDTTKGAATVPIPACSATAPVAGPGTLWTASAVVGTKDGDTTSLGGMVRLDDETLVDGRLCGENIQLADMIVIDDVDLAMTHTDDEERWSGAVTVANPERPAEPFTGAFEFAIADRQLQTAHLSASGLRLGSLATLDDLEFSFDRDDAQQEWNLDAALTQSGQTAAVAGALTIDDGVVVGGHLDIEGVRFGDAFTLTDLSLEYAGRRDRSEPWSAPLGVIGTTENNRCGSLPLGSNVPWGEGSATGAESYFRVMAQVEADGRSFGAAGQLAFHDGKLAMFDVTLDCVPLGSFATLEDVRVLYLANQSFALRGRIAKPAGASGSDTSVIGSVQLDDGRLVGGEIGIGGLAFGPTTLETFTLTVGQQQSGFTTWGAEVEVRNASGNLISGGGSISLDDGKIVAGSLTVPQIPLAELVTIHNVNVAFDGTQPGRTRIQGSGGLSAGDGSASVGVDMTFTEGRLTAGMFQASALKLFDVIPLGSFALGFDGDEDRWFGTFETNTGSLPGVPAIEAGIEIQNGRLLYGEIGFDADGDGQPDAPGTQTTTANTAAMSGFPLRVFHLQYCSAAATNPSCAGSLGSSWFGQIKVELPTEAAPAVDGWLRVTNGRFGGAGLHVTGLNVPVFSGVFLNSLGADVNVYPRLDLSGSIGMKVGSPGLTIATVTGTVFFAEMPELEPGQDPDEYVAEWLRFGVGADVEVFPGNPLGVDINGSVDIVMETRGFLGIGSEFEAEFIKKVIAVDGYFEGMVFNANNVEALHPDTGQPLTGAAFQIRGGVAAKLVGKNVASADALINNIGGAGCSKLGFLKIGAGFYWSGGKRLTCDLGRYEIQLVDDPFDSISHQSAPVAGAAVRAMTPTAVPRSLTTIEVAADEPMLGVQLESVNGAPNVELVAPDGRVYRGESDDEVKNGFIGTIGDDVQFFLVPEPRAGTWQVIARPGSAKVVEVSSYFALPEVDIDARVIEQDDRHALDFRIRDIPGQQVQFFERSPGERGMSGLGTRVSPKGPLVKPASLTVPALHRTVAAATPTAAEQTATAMAEDVIGFTPGGSSVGGPREIVAVVLQDGLPREEIVVATYTAPAATKASAPVVTATEVSGGAEVSWKPPANGGREIRSYRVSSGVGEPVVVEADARNARIEIPHLTDGKETIVIVEAFTELGWGEKGWTTFTASQETGGTNPDDEEPGTGDPGEGGGGSPDGVLPGFGAGPLGGGSVLPDLLDGLGTPGDEVVEPDEEVHAAPAPSSPPEHDRTVASPEGGSSTGLWTVVGLATLVALAAAWWLLAARRRDRDQGGALG